MKKLKSSGEIAINAALLPDLLNGLENNNAQSEYYLPDIVGLANKQNINIYLILKVMYLHIDWLLY